MMGADTDTTFKQLMRLADDYTAARVAGAGFHVARMRFEQALRNVLEGRDAYSIRTPKPDVRHGGTFIHKYELDLEDAPTIRTHEGAKFLHVADQHGALSLWALVDTRRPIREYTLFVYGTGGAIKVQVEQCYIGTAVMSDGFVWHVYECLQ